MQETSTGAYEETYGRWRRDPEGFWRELAVDIECLREPKVVLDASRAPLYRWFAGGQLNTCFNLLDRHVRDRRADQSALIYDSPVTDQIATYTYRELLDRTALGGRGAESAGATGWSYICRWSPRRSLR